MCFSCITSNGIVSVSHPRHDVAVVDIRVGAFYASDAVVISGVASVFTRTSSSGGKVHSYFWPGCSSSLYWKADRAPGTTRHEIGHGVDDLLQKYSKKASRFSQEPGFKHHWFDDWKKLPLEQQIDDFWYFIQADDVAFKRGSGEAFAEIFSGVTGGAKSSPETQRVLNAFPESTKIVRDKLNNLPPFKPPVKNYAQP